MTMPSMAAQNITQIPAVVLIVSISGGPIAAALRAGGENGHHLPSLGLCKLISTRKVDEFQSVFRSTIRRSMAVVMTVMPGVPVRIWMSVPRRVFVCGIAIVIQLTVPVDIAVIPLAAAAGHFDDIRHSRGARIRNGRTGIGRHRSGAQNQGTEQGQNCCTHRSRPSKPHRNNDAHSMEVCREALSPCEAAHRCGEVCAKVADPIHTIQNSKNHNTQAIQKTIRVSSRADRGLATFQRKCPLVCDVIHMRRRSSGDSRNDGGPVC